MTGFCNPELDEVMQASDRSLAFEDRKPLPRPGPGMLAETRVCSDLLQRDPGAGE